MDFITLDFETANRNRNSACELGLTFVKDGIVGETRSWLVKPIPNDFDYFNILLHGIRPEMVQDQPEFNALWPEVQPLLEGQFVIAHNAGFDISVLRRTLEQYSLPFPNMSYACSYIFAKRVWEGLPSYGLKELCAKNEIDFRHHRAGPDSRATAELALKAFERAGIEQPDDLPNKLRTTIGALFPGGFHACRAKSDRTNRWSTPHPSSFIGDPAKYDPDNLFFGQTVAFTGALSSMTRAEAQQAIADIGGINGVGVTKQTAFLVVGQQDYRLVGDDGLSGKQEKALKLKAAGVPIEIMSEADFKDHI